jgi:hypothetical protein
LTRLLAKISSPKFVQQQRHLSSRRVICASHKFLCHNVVALPMEGDDGQSRCSLSGTVPVLVTPTADESFESATPVDTTVVALGVYHLDHSDDERGETVDSPIDLSCLGSSSPVESPFATLTKIRTFPMTKFIVDGNNNYSTDDIPITNVILSLSKLINYCQSSFQCQNCHSVSGKSYTVERYGVASSLYFECLNCNLKTGCRATLTKSLEAKWSQKSQGKLFKDTKEDPVNASNFDLNKKLYLATHQCGGGLKEASILRLTMRTYMST